MPAFSIQPLADRPELVAALAPAIFAHYRDVIVEDTLADRVRKLESHMNRDAPPIAWVASDGNGALGTASLRVRDLDGWDHLTPWLGGVFVIGPHRRAGVGGALCRRVEDEAARMGYDRLHLFTLDRQDWYARAGWTVVGPTCWRGRPGHVMQKRLRP